MTKLNETRAILIVGATGQVGSCLTQQLVDSTDYNIAILVRNEDRARALFEAAIQSGRIRLYLTKQLTSSDLLNAMDGIDVVVWCAGPRSRSRLLDLLSPSPDSSKSVDYLAVQQLCTAVKQSTTIQRIIMIEPPEVDQPFHLRTIWGNMTRNYIYYWKANGECLIKGSGLDYTIIRPYNVQSTERSLHRSVGQISFHQGPTSIWPRFKRYAPIPIASLTNVISETIDRLDHTRRCTFEITGDRSDATTWDDLFDKLQPDQEIKSKSLVTRHKIAIGFGITCSMFATVGLGMAALKYIGYDQQISHFLQNWEVPDQNKPRT